MMYLFLVVLVLGFSSVVYLVIEEERVSRDELLASARSYTVDRLPFHPLHGDRSGFETTHSGGVCPNGASAPKTVTHGLPA